MVSLNQLADAVHALDPRTRALLNLSYGARLDDGEIANRVGLPPDEVVE